MTRRKYLAFSIRLEKTAFLFVLDAKLFVQQVLFYRGVDCYFTEMDGNA